MNPREYVYECHAWTRPVPGDALETIQRVYAAERQILQTVASW